MCPHLLWLSHTSQLCTKSITNKNCFLSLTNLLEKQVAVFNANKTLGQSVGLFVLFLGRQENCLLSVKATLLNCTWAVACLLPWTKHVS